MANPQKENGYTAISNEIMENITKVKLNGTQYRILITVWRYTYGFNRKSHYFSESFLSNAINGEERQVRRSLKSLIESKVLLIVEDYAGTKSRKLTFNKNYEEWVTEDIKVQSTKKSTLHGHKSPEYVDIKVHSSEDIKVHQERKKENIKENIKEKEVLKCFNFYNKNFGPIKPTTAEEIGHFLDDGIEDALIIRCLEMAKDKKAKNSWSYAKGILTNCLKNNTSDLKGFETQNKPKKKKSTSPDEFKNMMEDFING